MKFGTLAAVIAAIAMIALAMQRAPRTTVDPVSTEDRTGLEVYVDHMTGCHYLRPTTGGGITPRLQRDGKQYCEVAK